MTARLALPPRGQPYQWDAEAYEPHEAPSRRVLSGWRILVLCTGLLATTAAVACAWIAVWPTTLVQTRIVADGSLVAGRAALAAAALRLGTTPEQSAVLDEHGGALVIAVQDGDPAVARRRARSVTDSLLNLPIAPDPVPAATKPLPPAGSRAALLVNQSRLSAAADATDARAAAISASLTSLTRDMAAGARAAGERKGGRDTLDKGAAALADLQFQRIQLQSRYQDDYPAVIALEAQIRTLRSFLQDEARRVDTAAHSPSADPADPILGSERDRLRVELVQVINRRAALAAELAAVGRVLATPPTDTVPARPTLAATPAPVLIEAATTVVSSPDIRWISIPAVAALGLLLSLLAWFKPRYERGTLPPEMLLHHFETALAARTAAAALPPVGYPSLARDAPAFLPPRQRLNARPR